MPTPKDAAACAQQGVKAVVPSVAWAGRQAGMCSAVQHLQLRAEAVALAQLEANLGVGVQAEGDRRLWWHRLLDVCQRLQVACHHVRLAGWVK